MYFESLEITQMRRNCVEQMASLGLIDVTLFSSLFPLNSIEFHFEVENGRI